MSSKPTADTVPTSPQDQHPPGKPANPKGVDLTAPGKDGQRVTAPHLPHERDQDACMTDGKTDPVVHQGWRDLERGLEDTDQGLRADENNRKPETPA